ncbi:MAG: inositol monophosphatase [Pseudomonadota bacterium]|nr:inositol monophosphatase [Pseudomonadota bacterium]
MHPMINTAVKAARRAGQVINRGALNLDRIAVARKQPMDFVTEVDRASEQAIIDVLRDAYPDHAILAEESGFSGTDTAEFRWIIDPLDGTTNFIHGFPQYAVSIACQYRGQIQHGVIYDPVHNDLFTASRGTGAFLNERRIRVSRVDRLEEGLIGTGLPFGESRHLTRYLRILREIMVRAPGVRRAGAAALDLAYVAAGRLDGFWEIGLKPWDMAAGALMVLEAGGLVSDWQGGENWLEGSDVVCGSPKLFAQLLAVVQRSANAAAPSASTDSAAAPDEHGG